ncbi:MAG: response regulator [Bdellovibrionales bacterium]|nr:response regulator [Bdellovibrionales bacterium]
MKVNEVRVLIADGDNTLSNKLSNYLRDSGFSTKVINNSYLMQKTILEWRPHFIFIDLLFPGFYAQKLLKFLNERKLIGPDGVNVIVMSNHNAEMNVMNCLSAGAEDFIVKPLEMIDVLHRLALLSRAKRFNFENILSNNNEHQVKNYFQMINLLTQATAQNKPVRDLRFELIRMVSLALKAVRTSVYVTDSEKKRIAVVHSSDDQKLSRIDLDLEKYPELQYVLRTEKPLFIESLEKDKTMSFIKHEIKSINFDCMMVLPIMSGPKLRGCVSIKMPKEYRKLTFYDIKIAEVTAQLLAITWKFDNPKALKSVA